MAHRVLAHTADTGVEATAGSFPGLLEELLTAMFGLMAEIEGMAAERWLEVSVNSETPEELVVDALSEALSLAEVEDLVLCQFRVTEGEGQRAVDLRMGGILVSTVEAAGPAIKAVTYHGLALEQREDGWRGRVYFDV